MKNKKRFDVIITSDIIMDHTNKLVQFIAVDVVCVRWSSHASSGAFYD